MSTSLLRYLIGTIPLSLCVLMVIICAIFMAVGGIVQYIAENIAEKLMPIGDCIVDWIAVGRAK